ncbi:MAG TPA: hypothetical protein VK689_02365 [Armatimonadota bacterium]|nr:hypothetical protein [Armatimonadota bacterium]
MADDNIQHGIDDDPNNDAKKGATLGGLGGAAVGAAAGLGGSAATGAALGMAGGPVGAAVGAVVGGVAGAVASGLGVAAVDQVDNDNTVTGLGDGATTDVGHTASTVTPGNNIPGVQTGGHAVDGTMDTRGVTEKAADAVTGDHIDDKTGKPVI